MDQAPKTLVPTLPMMQLNRIFDLYPPAVVEANVFQTFHIQFVSTVSVKKLNS